MSGLLGKEILVVDDAEDTRRIVSKILENDGAQVHVAEDINTGQLLASSIHPHLIILDLQFEGKDGFDFLKQRRMSEQLRRIPVLSLSGKNDEGSVTHAISLGTNDYLLKPFRATLLLQKVRKLLKASAFQSYDFTPGTEPEVEVSLQAEVVQLMESGFHLETSTKFSADKILKVDSDFFQTLPLKEVIFKTASRASKLVAPGRYLQSVLFTGVGEHFIKALRKALEK